MSWSGPPEPDPPSLGVRDWLRVIRRGLPMAVVVFGGLGILLFIRLIERSIFGATRPITPHITVAVCRLSLWIMGLPHVMRGTIMRQRGAFVANHSSWLDIFVLNAAQPLYFVSKAEVAGWPGIGWLARATGTVFIARDRTQAAAQKVLFEKRLLAGHQLLFFPEGTSTDGRRVLPFRPTLFAAFFGDALRHELSVQPVTVIYHAPDQAPVAFYGWWGDMSFVTSLLTMLAQPRHGHVEVVYHTPMRVDASPNRKTLAKNAESTIRAAHAAAHALDV